MKIQCPKCKEVVVFDQVSMATDWTFCPQCNDGFKMSESIDQDSVDPDILRNPPQGAWFREEWDKVVVGASTRSAAAFLFLPFMCVWTGILVVIGFICVSQIVPCEFELGGFLLFLLVGIIFWTYTLMTVCGKVEVSIGKVSSIFVGIGSIGWTRRFDWSEVQTIREKGTYIRYPGSHQIAIVMEGKKRLKFGTGLNEKRRYFVLNVLKYLKAGITGGHTNRSYVLGR